MIDVSVIIPTYNGSAYIVDALESVFHQTLPPDEIIIVDDCSTDRTPHVLEDITKRSPIPLRVITLDHNSGGPAHPINIGIAQAQGEIVAVLDQDDLFHPQKLAAEAGALVAHPHLAVAFSFSNLLGNSSPAQPPETRQRLVAAATNCGSHLEIPGAAALALLMELGNYVLGYPGFTFRKSHWNEKGGVDESLRIASDMEFLAWLFSRGTAALNPHIGYSRRRHDANLVHQKRNLYLEVASVKMRYLRASRVLFTNTGVIRSVRRQLLRYSYKLRELKAYEDARKMLAYAKELGEPAYSRWPKAGKILIHQLRTQCSALVSKSRLD